MPPTRRGWRSQATASGGGTTYRIADGIIDSATGDALCKANPDDLFCKEWTPETPFPPPSQKDDRFLAALPQAPGGALVFADDGLSQFDIPIMIQAGRDDASTPYASEAVEPFDKLGAPAHLMSMEGAGHFTFSDMCEWISLIGISADAFSDGCSPDNIDSSQAQPVINAFALRV